MCVPFPLKVANSKVIAKEIILYNHGSKEGEFKIKYGGVKPISLVPCSGKVPPNSAQIIKVEYVTKQAGTFNEVAKVSGINFFFFDKVITRVGDLHLLKFFNPFISIYLLKFSYI